MNKEILMVVDAVSNEKGVDKEIIFDALEAALASATRKKYGEEIDVRVSINRKSGDYDTYRRWKVFADDSTELEFPDKELRMEDALDVSPDAEIGGYVGDGVGTTNLAGRTLADLIGGRESELTALPWVGHRSPRWEPEPARWLGVNLALRAMGWVDRQESRTGRTHPVGTLLNRLTGH